ncbi:MAG: peptidoglycan DD-metalloendopeptidase family protein [Propionibacteriaceae bacterium]|jgi:murein DD-endopeptidase MepM/ murein hydrolase activator NlpD|nr:peptidoglycan DD-metalloendopeptidase family protein [Propionibacteriaceae bacterium]
MKHILVLALVFLLSLGVVPEAHGASLEAVAPVVGDVVRDFDPPAQPWLAGHRGVDLSTRYGAQVLSAMDGVVSFAGMVAGRPVISIRHGDLTTTYEPVWAVVRAGDPVSVGQIIGNLSDGHECPQPTCLHWGLKRGETYLDPLSLLGGGNVRLITAEGVEAVRRRAAELRMSGWDGRISSSGLINPTSGTITSLYGLRLHPVYGVWRFHDGLDIATGCGTPLLAVAAGRVTESYYNSGYGYRLVIDHGRVSGRDLKTSYNHAQGYSVRVGDQVRQGQVVGTVGTTGTSTGCHLHFQTWIGGELVNPKPLLP